MSLMAQEMLLLLLPLLLLLLSRLWPESLAEDPGYNIKMQQSVTVQEGLCVFVPCSVFYPWNSQKQSEPAYGYWYHHGVDTHYDAPVATNNPRKAVQKRTKGRFQLTGDPQAYSCSLRITDANKADSGSYFFRVERGYYVKHSFREQSLFLSVTALTHTPEIQVPEMLKPGHPGSVICSVPWACDGGTPPNFSWRGAAKNSTVRKDRWSSVLTFTPQLRDHGSTLTCQVDFPSVRVTVRRTIQLNVSYPMTVNNGISLLVMEGQHLRLVCRADSNLTASLSWPWKRRDPGPSQVSVSRVLQLSSVGAEDGGKFTCKVHHPLGHQNFSFNLSVHNEQDSLWLLIFTLIEAAAMGAGLLLTYVLTWAYYTRCGTAKQYKKAKRCKHEDPVGRGRDSPGSVSLEILKSHHQ